MSLTDTGDRAVLAGALVRGAAVRVRAPDALRGRLEAQARAARGQRAARAGGTCLFGAFAATLAAACLALFVALPGGAPAEPSVARPRRSSTPRALARSPTRSSAARR